MGALQQIGNILTAGIKNVVEPAVAKVAKATNQEQLVQSTAETASSALDQAHEVLMRAAAPGRALLGKLGLGDMAEQMRKVDVDSHLSAGARLREVHEALTPFAVSPGKLQYNPDDMAHIVDLIENPMEKPRSQAHVDVAELIQRHLDEIGSAAEDLELPVFSGARYETVKRRALAKGATLEEAKRIAAKKARRPFQKTENYWPRYFDEATIQSYMGGEKHEVTLQELIDRRLAQDRPEAKALLTRMLRAPGEFRGGVLQHSRDNLNLTGYDKDIMSVLTRYFMASEKRLGTARAFGADDALAMGKISGISSNNVSSRKAAISVYKAWAGDADVDYRDLARFTNTIHAMTMLSTAGIVQPTQLTNTAAIIGWGRTLKAMSQVAKDWRKAKLDATSMGAVLDNIHRDFAPTEYKGLSEAWSRLIGLDGLDRVNRVVSAVGGKLWAQDTVDKIAKSSPEVQQAMLARWAPQFEKMGIKLEEVVERAKTGMAVLTDDELRQAGYYVANNSQFASGALDLPEFRNTTAGQFLYLFKSYALQQANFVQEHILKPAQEFRDARPAMRYLGGLLGGGITLGSAVRILKNRETPDDEKVRVIEDMALAGGFGMYFDAFRAMANGPQSVLNFAVGPTGSEAAQFLGSDIPAIFEGVANEGAPNLEPLEKHLTGRIPLAGQWLKNTIYDD